MGDLPAQKRREFWESVCLDAIAGWIGLGALTAICFYLFDPNFDVRWSVTVIMFRIVDGGILGAATGFAIDEIRCKAYGDAALTCFGSSTFVFLAYLALLLINNFNQDKQQDPYSIDLFIRLLLPLMWSVILFLCGLRLRKRAID